MASALGGTVDNGPYRVMVVEDATVIRAMLNRTLEQDPQIEVVTSATSGQPARLYAVGMPAGLAIADQAIVGVAA